MPPTSEIRWEDRGPYCDERRPRPPKPNHSLSRQSFEDVGNDKLQAKGSRPAPMVCSILIVPRELKGVLLHLCRSARPQKLGYRFDAKKIVNESCCDSLPGVGRPYRLHDFAGALPLRAAEILAHALNR